MSEYDPQSGRAMPEDPAPASGQLEVDGQDLHAGLAGLAGMLAGSQGVEDLLAQIAEFAAHAIPGADEAGVALLSPADGPPQMQAWGASADVVREIDRIQYELLDEGPCVACTHTLRPAVCGSLESETRWPRFGRRVAELGVHSALSLPLMIGDEVIGAINSYARGHDAFTEHAVRVGEQFAGPAAVAVRNAELLTVTRAKAEQLQSALNDRAIIDQAIGIVRSRTGGSSDEALGRLRQLSRSENLGLAVVAQRVLDDAIRNARGRRARR